jgi:hypothetical protein
MSNSKQDWMYGIFPQKTLYASSKWFWMSNMLVVMQCYVFLCAMYVLS